MRCRVLGVFWLSTLCWRLRDGEQGRGRDNVGMYGRGNLYVLVAARVGTHGVGGGVRGGRGFVSTDALLVDQANQYGFTTPGIWG